MKTLIKKMAKPLIAKYREHRLPPAARQVLQANRRGLPSEDPGIEASIAAALDWLCLAQDRSPTRDGGVARHYSLLHGWAPSYPETTGYIVPTLLDQAARRSRPDLRERAFRMLDWLVSIQFPDGAFQGGMITQQPVVPVTFNTGQILYGLAAGAADAEHGERYREPMRRAADWLRDSQDEDGKWSRFPTPFAEPGLKTYETHVAWALLEAERVAPGHGWVESALRQIRWALSLQRPNGFLQACCLTDPTRPLTHTLGYALRGITEGYLFDGGADLRDGAYRLARGLAGAMRSDGWLPGRLDAHFAAAAPWVCLTGTVQISHSLLLLGEAFDDAELRRAGRRGNAFVRRAQSRTGPPDSIGGIAGSFPIDGWYGHFQYINFAPKFHIDSNQLEADFQKKDE